MAQKRTLAAVALAALTACAPRVPVVAPPPPHTTTMPPAPSLQWAADLDDYKRRLAGRIVAASPEVFRAPLPRMMKSIVVLYIRVDRLGRPLDVSVFRSNGYRTLERRAVASVVDAVPLAPPDELLDDRGSLGFLETFLFRDDDRFQVRSLVGEAWKARATSASR